MAQGLRSHPPRQNPGRILLFVIKKSTMYNIFFIPIRQFGPPNPEELCAGRTVCVCDANPLDTSKHRLDTIPVGVELATHVTDRSPPPPCSVWPPPAIASSVPTRTRCTCPNREMVHPMPAPVRSVARRVAARRRRRPGITILSFCPLARIPIKCL